MDEQKQLIVAGAKQYANYIVGNIPQFDENGNMMYYFSGSLAMLLLSSASSIQYMYFSQDGKLVSQGKKLQVQQSNLDSLSSGVRRVGGDVDVITTNDVYFNGKGKIYHIGAVKQNCDLATTLCPNWARIGGTMYYDWLSYERSFASYDVVMLTMNDGNSVLVADPISMILHKMADAIVCKDSLANLANKGMSTPEREQKIMEKYQKDIMDFTSMFNGITPLYPDLIYSVVVRHVLDACPQTALTVVMAEEDSQRLNQFFEDASSYIEKENQEIFNDFVSAVSQENQRIVAENNDACDE